MLQKVYVQQENPPQLIGEGDEKLRRLDTIIQTDSIRHNNQSIKKGAYNDHLGQIFTLDQLASTLNIYDTDCHLIDKIKPQTEKETVVLDFAWSPRQQRLGLTLKDHSLCFSELSDGFKFQKRFTVSSIAVDYQSGIWFLEIQNAWVTTDRSNTIYFWNLETENLETKYSDPLSAPIVEIREIQHLKLVAVAQQDKKILLWDFVKSLVRIIIKLPSGGVHSMIYSYEYQVILTSGYENRINIFTINPSLCDYDLKGRLVGHPSMVTAIQVIKNTPIVVSTDDFGSVRLWDIRHLKCFQQLSIGNRAMITKILDLGDRDIIAFLGTRLNVMKLQIMKKTKTDESLTIIRVEYDPTTLSLIVCTRRDVRIFNSESGRLKKIYGGLLENPEDEIACFRTINQYKNFVLGDLRGKLTVFRFQNCEAIGRLTPHSNEICNLKVDTENNILISSGNDNKIQIQNLFKNSVLREMTNVFEGNMIQIMEVSIHHNILIVSSGNEMLIFEYEVGRLLSMVEFQQTEEITAISVINGYALIYVTTNVGLFYVFHFHVKDQSSVHIRLYSIIDIKNAIGEKDSQIFELTKQQNQAGILESFDDYEQMSKAGCQEWVTRMIVDTEISQNKVLAKQLAFLGTNRGRLILYDMKDLIVKREMKLHHHVNRRINYNPFRVGREDLRSASNKIQNEKFVVSNYVESHIGKIQVNNVQLTWQKMVHQDQIVGITLFQKNDWYIITNAVDGTIKIWNVEGQLKASMNINHPLPIEWNITNDNTLQFKTQFMYAMKIMQQLNQLEQLKNNHRATKMDEWLQRLVSKISAKKIHTDPKMGVSLMTQSQKLPPLQPTQSRPILMKDEFSPRDLRGKQAKNLLRGEYVETNLKTMNANKRIQDLQEEWRRQIAEGRSNDEALQEREKQRIAAQERENQFQFLEEGYHERILGNQNPGYHSEKLNPYSKELTRKLEARVIRSYKSLEQSQHSSAIHIQIQDISSPSRRIDSKLIKKKRTQDEFPPNSNRTILNELERKLDSIREYVPTKATQKRKITQDFYEYASLKNYIGDSIIQPESVLNTSRTSIAKSQIDINLNQNSNTIRAKRERMKIVLKSLNNNLKKSQSQVIGKRYQQSHAPTQTTLDESQNFKLPSIGSDRVQGHISKAISEVSSSLKAASRQARQKLENSRKCDLSNIINYNSVDESKLTIF